MSEPGQKATRWMKKQVLDRSDRELRARMEKEGHRFESALAVRVRAAMRHARVALSMDNASHETDRVSANKAVLPELGFINLGQGIYKLGHSVWQLEGSEGDVHVRRLKAETAPAAKFPARRSAQELARLGYPDGVVASMNGAERLLAILDNKSYVQPDFVLVRGMVARVASVVGNDYLVEFQDSGITCLQPIASCQGPGNSRLAGLEESAQALIATGELSRSEFARIAKEVSSDESLTREDMEGFIAAMDGAVAGSIQARVTQNRYAQSVMRWTEFNGSYVCDFGPTTHGLVEQTASQPDGFKWELYEKGKLSDTGTAATESEAQEDCVLAAGLVDSNAMPKAAQSDEWRTHADLPGEWHKKYSAVPQGALSVLHDVGGIIYAVRQDLFTWELRGNMTTILQQGEADSLEDAQDACDIAFEEEFDHMAKKEAQAWDGQFTAQAEWAGQASTKCEQLVDHLQDYDLVVQYEGLLHGVAHFLFKGSVNKAMLERLLPEGWDLLTFGHGAGFDYDFKKESQSTGWTRSDAGGWWEKFYDNGWVAAVDATGDSSLAYQASVYAADGGGQKIIGEFKTKGEAMDACDKAVAAGS